jgi:hypothetical protein
MCLKDFNTWMKTERFSNCLPRATKRSKSTSMIKTVGNLSSADFV